MELFPQPSSMGTGSTGEHLEESFTIHPQLLNPCVVAGIDSSVPESLHFSIQLNNTCQVSEYHKFHDAGDLGFQESGDNFLLSCQDTPQHGADIFSDFPQVPQSLYNQPQGNEGK